MAFEKSHWGYRYDDCELTISARRLWEHTELHQINPFRPITHQSISKPEYFIDVLDTASDKRGLTGKTLHDFAAGNYGNIPSLRASLLLNNIKSAQMNHWLWEIRHHLEMFLNRRAVRNRPSIFLPTSSAEPLGIIGLKCALISWLREHSHEKARPVQWHNRIQNLTLKGLKQGEIDATHIASFLLDDMAEDVILDGGLLCEEVRYDEYRLSIIPVLNSAANHLAWLQAPPSEYLKRIKPKIKGKHPPTPQWRDPVLGYWIDKVEWDDLLGPTRGWMAFNHRGNTLVTAKKPTGLFDSPEDAKAAANSDAGKVLPRLSAKGNWAQYRLTGGENYREWLVTLPYYPRTYFSSHYAHRNVLLHVRSDIRESADGEKVLFLQEVQSDWAQQARRQLQGVGEFDREIPTPPWLQEWPALALKLMLLHAAERGCDALAWTTGEEQVARYGGLGERGLLGLYDRSLPKEANRIMKPFGAKTEMIDIFLPVNFFVEPTETGYEILDADRNMIGTASTWRQAQQLIPDGAHEILGAMHGVKLEATQRAAILRRGFFAWGLGL